jgi:hypothetical protein
MTKYKLGDQVFVPVERLNTDVSCPFPVITGKVTAVNGRSVTVECPFGIGVKTIASSAVHSAQLSVCIIRVGDFWTERSLLDPIAKSIRHFLHLLIPDDQVKLYYVRSEQEFLYAFDQTSSAFTHYLIVGHGNSEGELMFSLGQSCAAKALASAMASKSTNKHDFIWLCCNSGDAKFAKHFSSAPFCRNHIGSFRTLNGATASHFAQAFFVRHLLEGSSFRVAFTKALAAVPGTDHFRHWQSGKLNA